jgi:hypothetical protein
MHHTQDLQIISGEWPSGQAAFAIVFLAIAAGE